MIYLPVFIFPSTEILLLKNNVGKELGAMKIGSGRINRLPRKEMRHRQIIAAFI